MGLFKRKSDDAGQIAELKEEIRVLRERLDAADAQKAELIARVDATDAAKDRLEARVDATDASKARLEAHAGSIDAMSKQLDSHAGDVSTLSSQVRQIADQLANSPAPPAPPSPEAGPPPAAPAESPTPAEPPTATPPPTAPPSSPPLASPPLASVVTDERVHEIEQRLADLDEVDDRLDALAAAVARQADAALAAGGEGIDPDQVTDMANRLEDLSVAVATHGTQLAATRERVDALEQAEAGDDEQVDEKTMEAVDDMRRQIGQMAERVTTLDRRLTNVSTELANQLTELSRDIDAATDRALGGSSLPPPMAAAAGADELVTDELATEELELRLAEKFDMAIDEVRESQERLAAEQARYEIKFREDLADLAERLRRPRSTI